MKKYFIKIGLIFIVITLAVYSQQRKLTVDDIYRNPALSSQSLLGVKWFDEGNKFSFIKYGEGTISLFEHDVLSGKEKKIIDGNELIDSDGDRILLYNYEWFPNDKYLLITGLIHARSVKSGGTFYIYDLERGEFKLIIDSEEEQVNAQISPDGKKIGFVRSNNLFVAEIETGKEKQLTFDGSETILNGIFDWVYEEEFSIINAWDWSPDSKSIAYWRLDQSNVPKVYITKYDSLYFPPTEQYYPKPGANNSLVKIGVVDIESAETVWMELGEETDIYIPRMEFTKDPGKVSIQRLNRLQNKLDFMIADIKTGKANIIITETDSCWVDVETDNLFFFKDNKRFIWSSERDGFLHLYLYDYNGNLVNQVTKGNWEIEKLISVDEEEGVVYYTSLERSPLNKDLYKINFDGSNKNRLTAEKGTHIIDMSSSCKYYIDKFSDVNTKPSTILFDNEGNELSKLIKADMTAFNEYDFSPVEFLTFTTSDGVELNAAMIKPADFDPSKKYPALIYNYSGPGSQEVKDEWGTSTSLRMYAQNGYVIFWLDNRGTGGRGKKFENIVYKNLGYYETIDITEGAKYLISTGFVDSERIGIYGSSYGGYIAALAILKAPDYFKVAIAGAPVINWRFYDTIYTERYMQTPELNPEGYRVSSAINYVNELKGKLLLIHGTADDNVHLQNTMAFVKALEKANKQFDLMLYPESMHGGFGKHYLQLMADYIYENL